MSKVLQILIYIYTINSVMNLLSLELNTHFLHRIILFKPSTESIVSFNLNIDCSLGPCQKPYALNKMEAVRYLLYLMHCITNYFSFLFLILQNFQVSKNFCFKVFQGFQDGCLKIQPMKGCQSRSSQSAVQPWVLITSLATQKLNFLKDYFPNILSKQSCVQTIYKAF